MNLNVTELGLIESALMILSNQIHEINKSKGFWAVTPPFPRMIALMHSELSEALEADRNEIMSDDKIPEFTGVEAELADTFIRILDCNSGYGLNVIKAVIAKMKYNETRPFMHGGKRY